jgi:hypothetical protein
MRSVETVLFLVVIATVVATFARRLRVPAPSLLVVAGVIIGLLPGIPAIEVTPEIVSLVVLPPLLFAAGEELPWRDLRAVWKPVTALAIGLVLGDAAVVGVVAVAISPAAAWHGLRPRRDPGRHRHRVAAAGAGARGDRAGGSAAVGVPAVGHPQGRSWRVPAVVTWAGARGVVPLAAALSIPLATDAGTPLEHRDLVLLLTTAVIVITLVVQGFTLAPLVRPSGIALSPGDVRQEHTFARLRLAKAALEHLDLVAESEAAPEHVVEQLRQSWQARAARVQSDDSPDSSAAPYRSLRRDLLAVEGAELNRLFEAGKITDGTRRRIQRVLDLEQAGLGEDEL